MTTPITIVRALTVCATAILLLFAPDHVWADRVCYSGESKYADKIAGDMQQHNSMVTKTGTFSVNEEYPGDGTELLTIAFSDRGKTLFKHQTRNDPNATATIILSAKTKAGDPAFVVALVQGKLGACEYVFVVRSGQFRVIPLGLKH